MRTFYIITLFLLHQTIFGQFIDTDIDPISKVEKTYLHTDRSLYFPGEDIWFKMYITQANHEVTMMSDIAYVDLISPKGDVVETATYKIEDGSTHGQFTIDSNWVGGIYKLRGYTKWMHNLGENSFFERKLTIQKVVKPKLQMKLDFLKEAHGPGSNVSLEVNLKDLENLPLANASSNFEVFIAGESILKQAIMASEKGVLNIAFKLPQQLTTTDVIVNITTIHEGITEAISRSVPVVLDNIDLQLLPESGVFLADTENTIAFKALNSYGKPADVKGYITSKSGERITAFESYHDGMGIFKITPMPNETYIAHITEPFVSQKHYVLPEVITKGLTLQLKEQTNEVLKLNVVSYEKMKATFTVADVFTTLYSEKITLKKGATTWYVPSKNFPKGIVTLTISSENDSYKAERLAFVKYDTQLNISIETDKEKYNTRERVAVTIKTTNDKGEGIPANLSVAVVDNKLLSFADDRQDNILSYLLLSSELKGVIHEPNFYFNPNEKKAETALDYVMLTHGWRSYLLQEQPSTTNATFMPDQHTVKTGVVRNHKGERTQANLLLFNNNTNQVMQFTTGEDGAYAFKIESGTGYTLVAYNESKDNLKIVKGREKPNYKKWKKANKKRAAQEKKEALQKNILKKPNQKTIKVKALGNTNVALKEGETLGEVVVTGYGGITKSRKSLGYAVTVIDDNAMSEVDVMRTLNGKVTGIEITGNSGAIGSGANFVIRGKSSINGDNRPLYIIDGVPFENTSGTASNFVDLDPTSIKSISVIKGLAASTLYGAQGANGVVLITTKDAYWYTSGSKSINNRKYKNYTSINIYDYNHTNYTWQKNFYIPNYKDVTAQELERTDFRQTVYWNPIIQTNSDGTVSFDYYNSDENTSFKIVAEGIDYKGEIGRAEVDYTVQNDLIVTTKLPAYLSIDDEVELAVQIKNNSAKVIHGELSILLPVTFQLLEDSEKIGITVPKDSFIVKNIKIKPLKAGNTKLKLLVKGDAKIDFVTLETNIVSPYFPMQASLAGTENNTFKIPVNSWKDESLDASLSVYTNVVGEVMDGIASMLRKPYGCFEQTSSATYPNVMVLQYLREMGISNPDIEEVALDYIKQGYKRLISFETKEGGFEWFGKTPPHETLTAFGILEFSEMKSVYDKVDQKMIDRTVAWLLDRRDGKGNFRKSKKGYDSFASSPTDVANAYILYTLSEVKTEQSLELEYQKAFTDALSSNDSYKLALMGCTAINLNKKQDSNALILKMVANIENFGLDKLPIENTITRSYGNDKKIETIAFSILTLLKHDNTNSLLITKLVEELLKSRKNGRFGATQATCMALKALIKYSKVQNKKLQSKEQLVILTVNGKKQSQKIIQNGDGKFIVEGLEEFLVKGVNDISIQFKDDENTFPYEVEINWVSSTPDTSLKCPINISTNLSAKSQKLGNTVRCTTTINNLKNEGLGMVTAIIGIPSGASVQTWQLKELMETNVIAYYELFDNNVVLYWRSLKASETIILNLDLKTEVSGDFIAPASSVYLYYGEEYKKWVKGNSLNIYQ